MKEKVSGTMQGEKRNVTGTMVLANNLMLIDVCFMSLQLYCNFQIMHKMHVKQDPKNIYWDFSIFKKKKL